MHIYVYIYILYIYRIHRYKSAHPPAHPPARHTHPPVRHTTGYKCYDINTDDHAEQCHGSDSDSAATKTESECHHEFNKANTFNAAACPEGCVFKAAPVMSKVIVPHAPDIQLPGWKPALSGACRKADGTDAGTKVNGKYGKTAGADPTRMTQFECAAACVAEPNCIGYHHGPWCAIFGKDIHLTPNSQGVRGEYPAGWGADYHTYPQTDANDPLSGTQVLTIDATKPNIQCACGAAPGIGRLPTHAPLSRLPPWPLPARVAQVHLRPHGPRC